MIFFFTLKISTNAQHHTEDAINSVPIHQVLTNVHAERASNLHLMGKHVRILTNVPNKNLAIILMGNAQILKEVINVLVNLDTSGNPTERLALVNYLLKFE